MSDNNKDYDKTFAVSDSNWQLIEKLYAKALTSNFDLITSSRIPNKFHLIWLGSKTPTRYFKLQKQLRDLHPCCEVIIWDDNLAANYPMINREAFNTATNWGEKSDILRYEILYNEGGVYMDGDFDILKPLTPFLNTCDLFTGMSQGKIFSLCNGLIGVVPKHPIIKCCIDGISAKVNRNVDQIMAETGPYHFTQCFLREADTANFINVALPPSYFYPWPHYVHFDDNQEKITEFVKPYSFTLHKWTASWAPWSPNFMR